MKTQKLLAAYQPYTQKWRCACRQLDLAVRRGRQSVLKNERGWGSGMNRLPDHLVPHRYFAIAVEKPTARPVSMLLSAKLLAFRCEFYSLEELSFGGGRAAR